MTIRQYMYVSTSVGLATKEVIETILTGARRFNTEHAITGFLLYEEGMFMQIIEGAPNAIDQVLERIHNDPRHKDITGFFDNTVEAREFPDWAMGSRSVPNLPEDVRDSYHTLTHNHESLLMDKEGDALVALNIMRIATGRATGKASGRAT